MTPSLPDGPTGRVLSLLGNAVESGNGWAAHCPAHEDRNRSLSIGIGDDGRCLLNCFAGCSTETITGKLNITTADLFPPRKPKPSKRDPWQPIWNSCVYRPDLAARYLAERLGHDIDPEDVPVSLKVGNIEYRDGNQSLGKFPAIVGKVDHLLTRKTLGVHRIYLDQTGTRKAEIPGGGPSKKSLGKISGGAVPLYVSRRFNGTPSLRMIAVSEGIETGFAFQLATQIPTDAAISASGMGAFVWPEETEQIIAVADHDKAGLDAAKELLSRATKAGLKCRLVVSDVEGEDILDVYRQRAGKVMDLLQKAEPYTLATIADDGDKPTYNRVKIEVVPTEAETVDATIDALPNAENLYEYAGQLSTVRRADPQEKVGGLVLPPSSTRIQQLDTPGVRNQISRVASYYTLREGDDGVDERPIHIPEWLPKAVRSAGYWPGVRTLAGVVSSPFLRPDGSIVEETGYDPQTGILFAGKTQFPPIPPSPTKGDADAAMSRLLGLYEDFEYANEYDRSAAIAELLTFAGRSMIVGSVPANVSTSPARGSGKSLQHQLPATVAFGHILPATCSPQTEEEWQKALLSIALAGIPVANYDNQNESRRIASSTLEGAITAGAIQARLLKSNAMSTVPLRTIFCFSGVNPDLSADMARRSLLITIVPTVENPEERHGFKIPNLLEHVHQNRQRLLIDALTVLKAHANAGYPGSGRLSEWGNFEEWSHKIRGAVTWLGLDDPCAGRQQLRDRVDAERGYIGQFLAALAEADPDGYGLTVSEILEFASSPPIGNEETAAAMAEAIGGICPSRERFPSPRSLGQKLRRLKDRIVNSYVLSQRQDRNIQRWIAVRHECGKSRKSGIVSFSDRKNSNTCDIDVPNRNGNHTSQATQATPAEINGHPSPSMSSYVLTEEETIWRNAMAD